jgi:hypothetical protein
VFGMVNMAPGFTRTAAVINGLSDPILDLWGPDGGSHARSAIGIAELPFNIPVGQKPKWRRRLPVTSGRQVRRDRGP